MKLVSAFAILMTIGVAFSDKNDEIQLKRDDIANGQRNELLQSVKSNATADDVLNILGKLQRRLGLLFNLTQEKNRVRFNMAAQNDALNKQIEDQDKTNAALHQRLEEQNKTIGALQQKIEDQNKTNAALHQKEEEQTKTIEALHQEVDQKEIMAALLLKAEKEKNKTSATVHEVFGIVYDLQEHIDSIVDVVIPALTQNCWDIYHQGDQNSGIYTIYSRDYDQKAMRVYCDMETDTGGPGWTLFQKRQDGSVSFNQSWDSYSEGFGDLSGEHWLGNRKLAQITGSNLTYQLRIELWDWDNQHRWAQYSSFRIMDESEKYKIRLGNYSGDTGDSLTYHNNMFFSTPDMDNDQSSSHCAQIYYWSGWWFNSCSDSGLNNPYHSSSLAGSWEGIVWDHWPGPKYSLKKVQMKIRPVLL